MKQTTTELMALFTLDYSKEADILNVHDSAKKTAQSEELGDFTVDFDKNDSVIGIEIVHACEFFAPLGITREQLSTASAELSVRNNIIWLGLKLTKGIKHIPIPVPLLA